jgi:hypothetical protein
MKHNNDNIFNESASFNMPEKKERDKGKYEDFILKLMGRIFLTKKVFFGFDEQKIAVIVTPTLKIAKIVASPKKQLSTFPFMDNQKLELDILKKWAEDNKYEITFSTPLPRLKEKFFNAFGDVVINENKKTIVFDLICEVDKSYLPDSIKEWIKSNPKKFIDKIQEIKNMLK